MTRETISASPHEFMLSPHPAAKRAAGIRATARVAGERGCLQRIDYAWYRCVLPAAYVAPALCLAAIAVSVSPASARSHHRSAHHAQAHAAIRCDGTTPNINRAPASAGRQRDASQMPQPGYAFVSPNPETRIVRYQPRRAYRKIVQETRVERGIAATRRAVSPTATPAPCPIRAA